MNTAQKIVLLGGGGFTPAALFRNSAVGAWYDPSDLSTLFQDSVGTTAVASDSDPVGLMLDKRLWGGRSLTQELSQQTELVSNGTFDTDTTGWTDASTAPATLTWSSGAAVLTADGTNRARARQSFATEVGKTYRLSVELSAAIDISLGTAPAGGEYFATFANTGTFVRYFVATTTAAHIQVHRVTSGSASFDNVTVKLVPGNHATQATSTARPLYKTAGGLHWIEGDGVDDWLRATFTIAQPIERVSAIRQISWTTGDQVFGGGSTNAGVLYQTIATPSLYLFSGTTTAANTGAAVGADVVATERHSGANSRLAINSGAYTTGDAGTTLPGGITLFASNGGAGPSNVRCYGLTMREGLLSDSQIGQLRKYYAKKAGVAL